MSSHHQVVVPLKPGSDGDATHVPPPGLHTLVDPPVLYLEKIGQQWMKNRGEARPGVNYVLQGLPSGYTMWARPRPSHPNHVDKYLYGHPSGKRFDSPNRFYPHFEYLMDNNGDSMGCPCTVCTGNTGLLPSRSSSSAGAQSSHPPSSRLVSPTQASSATASTTSASKMQSIGRPKTINADTDTSYVDEEGTPDVYRNLINKLRRHGTIDETIRESLSPDWRGEQKYFPELLRTLKEQAQWVPRTGDMVLYIRDLPEGVQVVRDKTTNLFRLYNELSDEYLGYPLWEAGLVAQTPTHIPTFSYLIESKEPKTSIIYSGLRLEPIADPNDSDKSISKKYKYVHLRQTRPLILWHELLQHIRREDWHPSIINALTLTSTVSLMGKRRFRGKWPDAMIYCQSIFLGFEMLAVGDTVRLLPTSKSGQMMCTDIMVIKSIRLKWFNLDNASNNDYDDERPYKSEIWVYGSAYTNDTSRSNENWLSDEILEPSKAATEYSQWYPLHPASKELAVPFSRLLGRLYERQALSFFLNSDPDQPPDLDTGRDGLVEARQYSRQHDLRITRELNVSWYWGDNRSDALDLRTINGMDVAKYDRERNVKDWRKNAKLFDGMSEDKNITNVKKSLDGFRKIDLHSFTAPETSSLPVRTQRAKQNTVSPNATDLPTNEINTFTSKKRSHNVDLDEDDKEIRNSTKVIEDGPYFTNKKKAKVFVVIN